MPKKPSALTNAKQMLETVGKNRKSQLETCVLISKDRKDDGMVTRVQVSETDIEVTHEWSPVPETSHTAVNAFIRGYRAAGGTGVAYSYWGSIQMYNHFAADAEGVMPSSDEAIVVARKRWDEFIAEVPVNRSIKSTRKRIPIVQPSSFAPPVPMPVVMPIPTPAPVPVVPDSAFAKLAAEAAAHAAAAAGPDLSQYT